VVSDFYYFSIIELKQKTKGSRDTMDSYLTQQMQGHFSAPSDKRKLRLQTLL